MPDKFWSELIVELAAQSLLLLVHDAKGKHKVAVVPVDSKKEE